MLKIEVTPKDCSLEEWGIKNSNVFWNLSPEKLANISVKKGMATKADSGALNVHTGKFTGRSPKDRFIVKDDITKDSVWWSDINIPFDADKFDALYNKVVSYLSDRDVYVRDAYACADSTYKLNIRAVTELPWMNMFVYNMFFKGQRQQNWKILRLNGQF